MASGAVTPAAGQRRLACVVMPGREQYGSLLAWASQIRWSKAFKNVGKRSPEHYGSLQSV